MGETGRGILEVAVMMVGVAALGMLVANAQGATSLISGSATAFGNLLRIIQQPGNGSGAVTGVMQQA